MCDFLVIGPLTSGCYYKGCFPTTRILPLRSRKCELKDPIFDRLKHIIMEIKGFQPTCSPSLELKLKLPAAVKRFFHMLPRWKYLTKRLKSRRLMMFGVSSSHASRTTAYCFILTGASCCALICGNLLSSTRQLNPPSLAALRNVCFFCFFFTTWRKLNMLSHIECIAARIRLWLLSVSAGQWSSFLRASHQRINHKPAPCLWCG